MSRHLTTRFGRFAASLVLIGFAGLFTAPLSVAHEVRPAYLDLREDAPGSFDVLFKTPMRGDARLALDVVFSGPVRIATPVISRMTDSVNRSAFAEIRGMFASLRKRQPSGAAYGSHSPAHRRAASDSQGDSNNR